MIDENGCFTTPNGDCISPGPCIHTPPIRKPSAEPVTISRADFDDYEAMRSALRDLLNWRGVINENPAFVMSGLLGDAEGLASALFNGPIWDEAERAYR